MKLIYQVISLCLVSFVVLASLTRKDDSPQKKYLIDATLQIQKQLIPTTSISQIRESYKSFEILCFFVKNEDLFIENAQILQKLERFITQQELDKLSINLGELVFDLQELSEIDWVDAYLKSVRTTYLLTLTGWKTNQSFEQKKAEAQAQIRTLRFLNTLQNWSNKQQIDKFLYDYHEVLNKGEIDWKSLYIDFVLPIEKAYLANIDITKSTLFEEVLSSENKPDTSKISLGKLLFYETALSSNFKRSCSSCHRPQKAFCDNRQTSLGFQLGTNLMRNSPTLINASYNTSFFHDGRAVDIPSVIASVVTHPDEFRNDFPTIIKRLSSSEEYVQKFEKVYQQKSINQLQIQDALTVFIKSLSSKKSVFDEWVREKNTTVDLSEGYNVFMKNCASCHFAGTFSGFLPPFYTKNEFYDGIKTPTLRNILLTQPYMHDGRLTELSDVIKKHYGEKLSDREHQALKTFLESLTDSEIDKTEPKSLPIMPIALNRKVGGYY
ncbi:cytochrome c peroxidase [Emticicia sp. W12TSBA100-4]|uniref:cytochrome-c peroxidase n=1 Tax=Emticicia sp. W12TSBA100-4 TaxID=3160965 RepID=UPI003305C164